MGGRKGEEAREHASRRFPWTGEATIRGKLLSPCGNAHIKDGKIIFPWFEGILNGTEGVLGLWAKGWDIVEVMEPLMPRFLHLTDATDAEILSFANQWGPIWWSGNPARPFFRPGGLDRNRGLFLDVDWQLEKMWEWRGKEDVAFYSSAASLLSFLIRAALGLRMEIGSLGRAGWAERIEPFFVPGVFGDLCRNISSINSSMAKEVLERILSTSSLGGACREEEPLNILLSDGFLPIVVAEAVIAITKQRERFFVCDGCERLYFRYRKLPGKDQLNFCDECTIGGKVAKRLYARKVRSSKPG